MKRFGMKSRERSLYLVAGAAAVFVAASTIVLAIRQGSWGPVESAGWIPALAVVTWPGAYRRRCRHGRRGSAW